jgi:hypothetical protein
MRVTHIYTNYIFCLGTFQGMVLYWLLLGLKKMYFVYKVKCRYSLNVKGIT